MTVVGKKFSVDFQQAVEINGNTQIMVQPEGQPVEKASVEQLGVALMEEDIIVNPDGIYPKMTVGFAENVVGDGSATAEEFSFRPTAGVNRNTLNDGAARIHTLKGNSVVVNQQNKGVNTRTQYGYQTSSNGATITITNVSATTPDYGNMADFVDFTIKSGHRYLAITDSTLDLYVNSLVGFFFRANAISDIAPDLNYDAVWLRTETNIPLLVGESESFDFEIIDLTLMFGAGNEPLTVAEYYQRKPIVINEDEYNEGTLVNLVPKAIKTTGLNQFNGTYAKVLGGVQYYLGGNYTSVGFTTEEGGTTEAITVPTSSEVVGGSAPADRLYTPSQNGYIYANGDSICISLYWPTEYGDLYGTYKPYKPFERDLSWIKTIKDSTGNAIFPNGMRSAGNVADEIRFNSTTQQWEAVQRVDVRPYAAGDESDSAVTTDGTNTNYTLATPTITPIVENINFDYDVSDYGTEELIVAEGVESAPLSASIEYSPNVLAMLKNAPGIANDVDMLKSQLSAITAQLATLTLNNN